MTIHRPTFFREFREAFGPLRQDQVDGLNATLDAYEQDPFVDIRHFAYYLATKKLECANTWRAIKEYGTAAYFNSRYGPQTRVGKTLGNTEPGDGAFYCGRGDVQCTGRANYTKATEKLGIDFVNHPDLMLVQANAYAVGKLFILAGWFTGKALGDYINETKDDPVNARRTINGLDKAQQIAADYRTFCGILKLSIDAPLVPATPVDPLPGLASIREQLDATIKSLTQIRNRLVAGGGG